MQPTPQLPLLCLFYPLESVRFIVHNRTRMFSYLFMRARRDDSSSNNHLCSLLLLVVLFSMNTHILENFHCDHLILVTPS